MHDIAEGWVPEQRVIHARKEEHSAKRRTEKHDGDRLIHVQNIRRFVCENSTSADCADNSNSVGHSIEDLCENHIAINDQLKPVTSCAHHFFDNSHASVVEAVV
jgi:hypothetical protein